jgi:hypothetical protein
MWHLKWTLPHQTTARPETPVLLLLFFIVVVIVVVIVGLYTFKVSIPNQVNNLAVGPV